MINPYDPKLMRQSLDAWQKSLDLYRRNPVIEAQQAWITGANSWLAWQQSVMKLWSR